MNQEGPDLDRIYSNEVLTAHQDGAIYINELSHPGKGLSIGINSTKLVLEGLDLKSYLGKIIETKQQLQQEWTNHITFNNFDTAAVELIKTEKPSVNKTMEEIDIFLTNLNKAPSNFITTLGFSTTSEKGQEQIELFDRVFFRSLVKRNLQGYFRTIPLVNISSETDWESECIKEIIAYTFKFGTSILQNLKNGTIFPSDLDNTGKTPDPAINYSRPGGIQASPSQGGILGSVTINLPRLGYLSRDEEDFFHLLEKMIIVSQAALEQKREHMTGLLLDGELPETSKFVESLDWHFGAISIVGMNEALLNVIDAGVSHIAGKAVTYKLLEFMLVKIEELQNETGHLFSLEAHPTEMIGTLMALQDKEKYPDIQCSGQLSAYYTGATDLPPYHGDDLWDHFEHQKKYQSMYRGGTFIQINLDKGIDYQEECGVLLRRVFDEFGFNYLGVSPVFSLCDEHGYIYGEQSVCPVCGEKTTIYTRFDGYYQAFNKLGNGLKEVYRQRVRHDVKNS